VLDANPLSSCWSRHNRRRMNANRLRVRLGGHEIDGGVVYPVAAVAVHPGYSHARGDFDRDVALLRLSGRGADMSARVRPICLPTSGEIGQGKKGEAISSLDEEHDHDATATILGWGHVAPGGPRSKELMRLDLPVFGREKCLKMSKYDDDEITEDMICAGFVEGGRDACVVITVGGGHDRLRFNARFSRVGRQRRGYDQEKGGQELRDHRLEMSIVKPMLKCFIGIVSWGQKCASAGFPGVYTKMGSHIGWLSQVTADSCFCQ